MSVKLRSPVICTGRCQTVPQPYCIKCSHAIFGGRKNGVTWQFEPMSGFRFYKRGKEVELDANSPIWGDVEAWHKRLVKNYEVQS